MGLDLGFKLAGFDIKLCVEKDRWACRTIRANSSIPVIEADINKLSASEILRKAGLKRNKVDLVIGGPPCQAFSSAGKQRALSDMRGNLILKYISIVNEIKPRFFVMENVRGLLSAKLDPFIPTIFEKNKDVCGLKGSLMYYIVSEFQNMGYSVSFSLFNSANYGVPQKRERVIILGHLGEQAIPLPIPTHYEKTKKNISLFKNSELKEWVSIGKAFGNWNTDLYNYKELQEAKVEDYEKLRKEQRKYMSLIKAGQCWTSLPVSLQKEALGKSYYLGGGKTGFFRRLSFDEPSPTLVTSPTMPATLLCHPKELRPLSCKEYARIQMFPSYWEFQGSIHQKYKQIGNAVPVGLSYTFAQQIKIFDVQNKFKDIFKKSGYKSLIKENKKNLKFSRYKNTTDYEFLKDFEKRAKLTNPT